MATRSEEEVVNLAAQMKTKLVMRGNTMEKMINRIAKSEAGMTRKLHPELKETLERDLATLQVKQHDDSVVYATLRWMLCVREDIDWGTLELDK